MLDLTQIFKMYKGISTITLRDLFTVDVDDNKKGTTTDTRVNWSKGDAQVVMLSFFIMM